MPAVWLQKPSIQLAWIADVCRIRRVSLQPIIMMRGQDAARAEVGHLVILFLGPDYRVIVIVLRVILYKAAARVQLIITRLRKARFGHVADRVATWLIRLLNSGHILKGRKYLYVTKQGIGI